MNALEYVQPPLARGISTPRTPEILLITFAKQKRSSHSLLRSARGAPHGSPEGQAYARLTAISLAVRQGEQRLVAPLWGSVIRVTPSSTYHSLFSTSGLRYRDKNLTSFPLRYRSDVPERPRIDFKAYERKKPHTNLKKACTRF